MDIKRAGSRSSGKGLADWFTGSVRIDPLFPVALPARAAGSAVTFEAGARTHPLGQVSSSSLASAGSGAPADQSRKSNRRHGLVRAG
jgi:hypothetical protein